MSSNPNEVMPDVLPSADVLSEQAYLVARGVRRLGDYPLDVGTRTQSVGY
jgi:hypothetical protein